MINDGIKLLIFNARSVSDWHFNLLTSVENDIDNHEAVKDGTWSRQQGVVFVLSDLLKEKYEMMLDDIEVKHIADHPPYLKFFRQDLIGGLARHAFNLVDWYALASTIIARRNES